MGGSASRARKGKSAASLRCRIRGIRRNPTSSGCGAGLQSLSRSATRADHPTRVVRPLRKLLSSAGPGPTNRSGGAAHDWLGQAAPLLERFVVRPLPGVRNRREATLLPFRLEAKPPGRKFRGDRRAGMFFCPPLQAGPSFGCIDPLFILHSTLEESALQRCGMDLPHIPDLALPVLELSVHPGSHVVKFDFSSSEMLASEFARVLVVAVKSL
jgi:hypothetical protein